MKKSYIPIIIVVLIIVVGGIAALASGGATNDIAQNTTPPPPTVVPPSATPPVSLTPPSATPVPPQSIPPGGTFSDENDIGGGADVMVYEIVYDGSTYTPPTLTIKQGDIVQFQNNSKDSFWPASAPHPKHTDYPEFDAKGALGPGKTFDFKFTKVGTWKFHDHIKPSAFGSITVEK